MEKSMNDISTFTKGQKWSRIKRDSCKYVMEQFKKRHPNVNVNVVSHRSDRSEVNKKRNRVFEFDVKKKVKQNEAKK